jgi:hypothetical protein
MDDIKIIKHSDFDEWKEAPGVILHSSYEIAYGRQIRNIQQLLMDNRVIEAYLALSDLDLKIQQDFVTAWRIDGKAAIKELNDD